VPAGLAFLAAMAVASPPDPADFREIETWRAARVARLAAEDGWLSVVGLFWLDEGENPVGAAPASTVRLPPGKAPARVGTIVVSDKALSFRAQPGVEVTSGGQAIERHALASDADGEPTILSSGPLRFYVLERGGRFGVRVKDSTSAARTAFRGLSYFPIDPAWRLGARFEPYEPPRTISVPNVLGHVDAERSPGALVFVHGGKTYRLDPVLERGETDYFVIFGDRTNGTDTYGAGRFLYVPPPVGGKTVIDFNKAYNPPCVFTEYATCPLPPAQNKLPIRVEAGEKEYAH
jgi:uncharacterized protein